MVVVAWAVSSNCRSFYILRYMGVFLALTPSLLIILVFCNVEKNTFYGGVAGLYASIFGGAYFYLECGSMDGIVVIIYATSYVAVSCALTLILIFIFKALDK